MKIRLNFTVSESGLPALITIWERRCGLVFYKTVNSRKESLCFLAESGNLTVSVRPLNSEFSEKKYYFKLGPCPFYEINLNFVFSEEVSVQRFRLFDANYLFPIETAALVFTGR